MFVKYDFSQEFMEIECTPKTRGKPKKLKTFNGNITEDWQYLLPKKKTFYHYANQMLYPVITGHFMRTSQ
jgi:hypothetical protein